MGVHPSDILRRRERAADASGGSSDEVIYQAIQRALAAAGAHGDLLDFGCGAGELNSRLGHAVRARGIT